MLLFVLMLPYNVYFIERYRERRARRPDEDGLDSTLAALRSIALPCLFSCATTIAGFAALAVAAKYNAGFLVFSFAAAWVEAWRRGVRPFLDGRGMAALVAAVLVAVVGLLAGPPRFQCPGNDFEYDPATGTLGLTITDDSRC